MFLIMPVESARGCERTLVHVCVSRPDGRAHPYTGLRLSMNRAAEMDSTVVTSAASAEVTARGSD